MKFASPVTGYSLLFLSALATALPAAETTDVGLTSSNDNSVGQGFTNNSISLSTRQEEYPSHPPFIGQTTLQEVLGVIYEMDEHTGRNRDIFAPEAVRRLRERFGYLNWVITCVNHEYIFDGVEREDWGRASHLFTPEGHGSSGFHFHIYGFKSGVFARTGDGGYINWAYNGKLIAQSIEGGLVMFGQ